MGNSVAIQASASSAGSGSILRFSSPSRPARRALLAPPELSAAPPVALLDAARWGAPSSPGAAVTRPAAPPSRRAIFDEPELPDLAGDDLVAGPDDERLVPLDLLDEEDIR